MPYHEKDIGIAAEWHFFATSCGKWPYDGIGGTQKGLVAKASLRSSLLRRIDNAEEITVLKNRFATAKQIRGTHNYHSFIPVSKTKIYS
ncbi:hypothetical protein J437_LFUL017355, partial [Ladona fulva]